MLQVDGEQVVVPGMFDVNETMSVAAECFDGGLHAASNAVDAAAVTSLDLAYVIPAGFAGVLEVGCVDLKFSPYSRLTIFCISNVFTF